jgi:hypothetical protein
LSLNGNSNCRQSGVLIVADQENVLSRAGRYRLITEARSKISDCGKSSEFERNDISSGNRDKAKKRGIKSKPLLSPLRVKEVEVEGRRYIVCFNVLQAKKEKKDRVEILKGLSSQLKRGGERREESNRQQGLSQIYKGRR